MSATNTPELVNVYGGKALITVSELNKILKFNKELSEKVKNLTDTVKKQQVTISNLEEITKKDLEHLNDKLKRTEEKLSLLAESIKTYIGGQL